MEGPEAIALAVSIDVAYSRWLSASGKRRYEEPLALARAIRDERLDPAAFRPDLVLNEAGHPLFVTDAAEFERPGPSAARRLCLTGPPARSYVVAIVPVSVLAGPLHVPTAADAVCRPHFLPVEAGARAGTTCSGRPEFVTQPIVLGDVGEFRLSR